MALAESTIPGFMPGQPGQVFFHNGTFPGGWDAWGEKRLSYFSRLDLSTGEGAINYRNDDINDLVCIAEETIHHAMGDYDCKIEMINPPSKEGQFTVKIMWNN